jgi:hypothetical protein
MQTIYYISDVNGHRISINKPFSDDEINRPRIAPNWRENEEKERSERGRSINSDAAPRAQSQTAAAAAKEAAKEAAREAAEKDRYTQAPKLIPTRLSKVRERPRVASLPDRPKNVEFKDHPEEKKEEEAAAEEEKIDESEQPQEEKNE